MVVLVFFAVMHEMGIKDASFFSSTFWRWHQQYLQRSFLNFFLFFMRWVLKQFFLISEGSVNIIYKEVFSDFFSSSSSFFGGGGVDVFCCSSWDEMGIKGASFSLLFFFSYFLEVVSSILTKEFSLSLLLLLLPSLEEVGLMFFAVLHEMGIEGASFSLFFFLCFLKVVSTLFTKEFS